MSNDLFDITASERRATSTTRMPERKNNQLVRRHSTASTLYSGDAAKPFEEFRGCHGLATVSLSDGSCQFGLELRRKIESLISVASQPSHDGPLGQGRAFEDDFSVNDSTSGELHMQNATRGWWRRKTVTSNAR